MWNDWKVIDADAHFHEPIDLWDKWLEPAYKDRVPKVIGLNGINFIYEPDGKIIPMGEGKTGHSSEAYRWLEQKYGEAYHRWWSSDIRLADMDTFGWDIQVILPTGGNGNFAADASLKDPDVGAALSRAYHNFCVDYCSLNSARLKFIAVLPAGDTFLMMEEAKRSLEELGAVAFRTPLLPDGKWLHHREFDVLWELATDCDVPVLCHGEYLRRRFQPFASIKREESAFAALDHAIGFAFDNMASVGQFIFGGILERNPKLRVGILESNVGWVPFWLDRLDAHAEGRQSAFGDSTLMTLKPSEYFMRQCIISADADEGSMKYAVDYLGDDHIVFNTDYPHPDAPDPKSVRPSFLEQSISDKAKKKILWDNAITLYGKKLETEFESYLKTKELL